jgi:glycosyltransferase involved in cell wall biosynthesis
MRLTIITPTRNIVRWLPECLESVRAQQGDAELVEHLVLDGESTDGSAAVARRHGARVMEVRHQGLYAKINLGAKHASGDVLGYLGGDDVLLPGAVKVVDEWFESERNPMLVGAIRWMDVEGRSRGDLAPPPAWMSSEVYASLGWSCIQTTSVFIRREFMEELGGYDESYEFSGDYEFFARALTRARFDRSSRSLSAWRMHGHNLSRSKAAGIESERIRIEATFAPKSLAKRTAYRHALKIWLNATSPRWFLHKRLSDMFPEDRDNRGEAARVTDIDVSPRRHGESSGR